MKLRAAIYVLLVIAVAVWCLVLYLRQVPISWEMLTPFGLTSGIVSAAAVAFDRYFWRWRHFRGWLVERPFYGGTWKATIHSTYKVKGQRIAPKTVYVVIRQTLTSLSFRLYSDRAKSSSIAESIYKDGTDLFGLSVSYHSVPEINERNGISEIHFGSALFMHLDYDIESIDGHYFTDRKTAGSLVLHERARFYATSYDQAVRLFVDRNAAL